jgi:transcription antitermination factor NusG
MPKLLPVFAPGDRVRIASGILHGFTATVVAVERPERVAVAVDQLEGAAAVIVRGEFLERCEAESSHA